MMSLLSLNVKVVVKGIYRSNTSNLILTIKAVDLAANIFR
jgi:hypothetical protein